MLGIGESALKVRLHRARIALRESLVPYLDGSSQAAEKRARPGASGENQ
jgi:hypothetical protein